MRGKICVRKDDSRDAPGTDTPRHVGILGPIILSEFKQYVHASAWHERLPVGQGGTPVNFLGRALLARGIRVTIFTLDVAAREELVLEGPLLRICVLPLGLPKGRRPARDFFRRERRALLAAVLRERPPVLHAHWLYYYAMAAQASRLPHIVTAHDAPLNVLRRQFIPHRIAHTLMALSVTARARCIASVSPYVADHLRRYMLYRGPRIVVANGLPESVFALRSEGPFALDAPVFATSLTGWNELKNGRALLQAFGIVGARLPKARLIMMGCGHEPSGPAAAWARDNGLSDGVEFAGQLPQSVALQRLSREVDVYVHPSREEACSMVLAEACAMGLPCIGGRMSGGVPFSLDDGRAGVLVDLDDPGELPNAMLRLAIDPDERRRLGAAAYAYARNQFRVDAVVDSYLELYDRVERAAKRV